MVVGSGPTRSRSSSAKLNGLTSLIQTKPTRSRSSSAKLNGLTSLIQTKRVDIDHDDTEKEKGYDSGDSYNSATFDRTKEDNDFIDMEGSSSCMETVHADADNEDDDLFADLEEAAAITLKRKMAARRVDVDHDDTEKGKGYDSGNSDLCEVHARIMLYLIHQHLDHLPRPSPFVCCSICNLAQSPEPLIVERELLTIIQNLVEVPDHLLVEFDMIHQYTDKVVDCPEFAAVQRPSCDAGVSFPGHVHIYRVCLLPSPPEEMPPTPKK